jgi:pimeloyl-ACP methyl ester carboxylesterase
MSARADEGTFDSNGVRIRYVTAGEGKPVVLIHGWMADASMWGRDSSGNPMPSTKNAAGFRLIALDCRGHGQSDKPHDPALYGPEMAADVVRLLDHLQIEKAHLIGYSSGSYIAGKVASTHPDRVLSIVYGGQAPLVAEAEKTSDSSAEADERPSEVEIFAQAVDEGKDLGSYIIAVTPSHKPKPTEAQASAIARFLYGGKDVKAFAAAGRSFKNLEVALDDLKKCPAPNLFIHGANESEGLKTHVATVHKLLGRGEIKLVEGADHITTLGKPEFGAAILEFLRAVPDQ